MHFWFSAVLGLGVLLLLWCVVLLIFQYFYFFSIVLAFSSVGPCHPKLTCKTDVLSNG